MFLFFASTQWVNYLSSIKIISKHQRALWWHGTLDSLIVRAFQSWDTGSNPTRTKRDNKYKNIITNLSHTFCLSNFAWKKSIRLYIALWTFALENFAWKSLHGYIALWTCQILLEKFAWKSLQVNLSNFSLKTKQILLEKNLYGYSIVNLSNFA